MNAAEGLSKKQINLKTVDAEGQYGFDFISMFPRIKFNPSLDKNNLYVKIQSEVYEQMVPIESYCLLDLKLIAEFNSGNTIRLYEIFKSYAFRHRISLSFDSLRKRLGFFNEGVYSEWKYFNAKVLKKAVADINQYKTFDIEVLYDKKIGCDEIDFTIITLKKQDQKNFQILTLNESIINRQPNLIQTKYIDTTIDFCNKSLNNLLNKNEIKEWIISDLISSQTKKGADFDFKHSMNAISNQLRRGEFTRPFSHRHLSDPSVIVFEEEIYAQMKTLIRENKLCELIERFTSEQIQVHQLGYVLEM